MLYQLNFVSGLCVDDLDLPLVTLQLLQLTSQVDESVLSYLFIFDYVCVFVWLMCSTCCWCLGRPEGIKCLRDGTVGGCKHLPVRAGN